jgi:adenosine kinase
MAKKIVGFGNPLLDISANVEQAVLDEWGAQLNNAILAEEKHQPLYAKLASTHAVEYIAGGATLNSIRVAQWLLTSAEKGSCTSFIGCIGTDEFGAKMEEQLSADKVTPLFMKTTDTPTGTCAVLVKEKERSLIANLASAEKYSIEHFKSVQPTIDAAQIFYMAGFPLTHEGGAATVAAICKHAAEQDKTVCMNVSAPFIAIVPPFRAALLEALKFCTFVFCNESEAATLAENMGWTDCSDTKAIALKMATLPSEKAGGLTAVVTQGSDATLVAKADGSISVYEVKGNPWTLSAENLVDTNGAGDAFVGGFLSQLAISSDEATCVRVGHFAAGTIIQQSGCTCPPMDTVSKVLG